MNTSRLITGVLMLLSLKAAAQTACAGKNGNDIRVTKEKTIGITEKGKFKCDELTDGRIIYKDTAGNTLYTLIIKEHRYKGEWNVKTKKENTDKSHRQEEEGTFEKGILISGKKYLYNKDGILFKILLLQDGMILGEVPMQE